MLEDVFGLPLQMFDLVVIRWCDLLIANDIDIRVISQTLLRPRDTAACVSHISPSG